MLKPSTANVITKRAFAMVIANLKVDLLYGWIDPRGMVVAANTQGYAVAVKALGATPRRIYARHGKRDFPDDALGQHRRRLAA
jgi:ABC-type dipeptide/oligopeptide/nickel transport system permease component